MIPHDFVPEYKRRLTRRQRRRLAIEAALAGIGLAIFIALSLILLSMFF